MIAVFTGTSRAPGMTARQSAVLAGWLAANRVNVLIHGGCVLADDQADQIAVDLDIARVICPQDDVPRKRIDDIIFRKRVNSRTGKPPTMPVSILAPRPALVRNKLMLKMHGVHRLIACPHEPKEIIRSGTWATIREGRRRLGQHNVEVILP